MLGMNARSQDFCHLQAGVDDGDGLVWRRWLLQSGCAHTAQRTTTRRDGMHELGGMYALGDRYGWVFFEPARQVEARHGCSIRQATPCREAMLTLSKCSKCSELCSKCSKCSQRHVELRLVLRPAERHARRARGRAARRAVAADVVDRLGHAGQSCWPVVLAMRQLQKTPVALATSVELKVRHFRFRHRWSGCPGGG